MTQTTTADGRDRWLVPSASQPEPRIVIRARGQLTCDCPAGVYNRRPCRHILAVQTVIAAEEATRADARRELRAEGVGILLAAGRRQEVA